MACRGLAHCRALSSSQWHKDYDPGEAVRLRELLHGHGLDAKWQRRDAPFRRFGFVLGG